MFLFGVTKLMCYLCTRKQNIKVMATINEMIAAAIAECMDDSEGKFAVEVEVDENTTVEASGWYEIDGYCEDDYFSGTGAWVTTHVCVSVEAVDVFAYNEDGEEVPSSIEPDIEAIERYAEDMAA